MKPARDALNDAQTALDDHVGLGRGLEGCLVCQAFVRQGCMGGVIADPDECYKNCKTYRRLWKKWAERLWKKWAEALDATRLKRLK